jgi:hypothetical protein
MNVDYFPDNDKTPVIHLGALIHNRSQFAAEIVRDNLVKVCGRFIVNASIVKNPFIMKLIKENAEWNDEYVRYKQSERMFRVDDSHEWNCLVFNDIFPNVGHLVMSFAKSIDEWPTTIAQFLESPRMCRIVGYDYEAIRDHFGPVCHELLARMLHPRNKDKWSDWGL